MTRKLYDAQGHWVELDARHRIAREGTGDPKRAWVFRFCDDWVSSHPTKREATSAALEWEMARVTRMVG